MKRNLRKYFAVLISIIAVMVITCACGSGEAGEVYVYCYGDYFDPIVVDQFEQETGIKVILDSYDTAEEMFTYIENGSSPYDVICTSDYMIEKMIANDMLAEIDKSNVPQLENIADVYMKKSEVFDPGNKYSVPYQAGTAGILYSKNMVGDTVIDSWEDLWDEKFADQIVMPDSVRDAFMIALKKLGYSENTSNEDEIKSAAAELMAQKGLVYKYANDSARDMLATESAALGVVWNGEYIYTKELNENVEFVVPKEGSEFFIDSWVILNTAANKENAEKWIDFLCSAEVACTNFDYLHYTTPNEAAYDLIEKEYLEDEAVFPTDETIERCESLRMLDDETTDLYSKYWKEVKAK